MLEIVKTLEKLQDVDLKIMEIKRKYAELPVLLKEKDDLLANQKALLEKDELELKNVKSEYSKLNKEIEEKKIRLKKFEEHLIRTTTSKEFKAANSEIVNAKQEISKLEEQMLIVLDKIDKAEKKYKENLESIKVLEEKLANEKENLKKEFSSLDGDLEKYTNESNSIRKTIDNEIIREYDRIFKRNNGSTIVKVIHNNTCGGCFMVLRPQLLVEVRKLKKLCNCDMCGRFLYWEDSTSEK